MKVQFDGRAVVVSAFFPGGDFRDEEAPVLDAAVEALAAQDADLDFDLVQPAGVSWRVVELDPLEDTARLVRWESVVERTGGMG